MRRYSIGAVCRALEVKPHIVRYWEREVGILSPGKDNGGRRAYTEADLQLLFRIKYLVHERKYTVKGAAMRIVEEASGKGADTKARIHEVRGELLSVLGRIRRRDADTQGDEPEPHETS
ncbi:MAG: MerR family transcriptional regulator [Spirochaetota bacterium]